MLDTSAHTDVWLFANRFDLAERELYEAREPLTVREFIATNFKEITALREIDGCEVVEFTRPTMCVFNGQPLMRAAWDTALVTDAKVISFHTLPAGGGGGGGGGSNPLGIVLALAIAVAAPYLGALAGEAVGTALSVSTALGTSIATGVAGVALGALAVGVMSLFMPPSAPSGLVDPAYGSGVTQSSPTYDLTAQGNTARLQQPIPVLYGLSKIFPNYVMPPYTQYEDNDQYLYVLLAVTQGECDISSVQIGDTPVSSFASITWAKVEPGVDTTIVDTRLLPCTDLTDTVLADAGATPPSPWEGPFAACPPGVKINKFEIDLVCPRGLYSFNSSGGFDARSVTVEVEVEEIDDTGAPVTGASWSLIDTITMTAASNTAQRLTNRYTFASTSRWQVRLRRTDTMDTSASAGHQVDWTGLRGRLVSARKYDNVTLIEAKMKATGDLNNQTSRQLNVIATRKLPTWDPTLNGGAGGMTTTATTTRSICDAFVDVIRNTIYGARQDDSVIDLAGIYAQKAELDGYGWSFDYVFDQSGLTWDALKTIAQAAIGVPVVQGNKVRLVRDVPATAPVMMFTPRNIRQGTLALDYKMVDEETADCIIATYMDPVSWKPVTLTEAFDDSAQENPTSFALNGITVRAQARAIVWNMLRANRYRRRVIGWGTEMEGLLLQYGDPASFSYDIPNWGQSAEIVAWDAGTRKATLSEEMVFTAGVAHYLAIRDTDGTATGPFLATAGAKPNEIVVGAGDLPTILTDGDAERSYIQFGPGSAYAKRVKIIQVTPRDTWTADIQAIDDDPRMYDPVPAEVVVPIGVRTDPITVHISADVANVNLRTLADSADFTGLTIQQVTFILDAGVEVYSNNASTPAMVRGSWPSGYTPTLKILGTITGAGGKGYDVGTGSSAQSGGAALDARTGPLKIDDASNGTARGGGGGGGAGGPTLYTPDGVTYAQQAPGAGGGGQGRNGGAGGVNSSGGSNGSAGNSASHGNGGPGDATVTVDGNGNPVNPGGAGGNGGNFGSVGATGGDGTDYSGGGFYPNQLGKSGGAAGPAVLGNGNIDWGSSTVTKTGPVVT